MQVSLKRIQDIQQSDEQINNEDLSLLASCEVINHIASKHASSYRLSAGAKRMLILKRLDKCKSDRDFALLMRLLNDIDTAEDKSTGAFKDQVNCFEWSNTIDTETN